MNKAKFPRGVEGLGSVGGLHTRLSPRKPEFASCLKPSFTSHFLNITKGFFPLTSLNLTDVFPNLTMWMWWLNLTSHLRYFMPKLTQSNADLVHQDKTHGENLGMSSRDAKR